MNYFPRFQIELNSAFKEKGQECNIEFVPMRKTIENAKKLFTKENQDNSNLCDDFNKNIDTAIDQIFYKDQDYKDQDHLHRDRALDILKILGMFQPGNILLADFDSKEENLNVNIIDSEKNLPKFSLFSPYEDCLEILNHKNYLLNKRLEEYNNGDIVQKEEIINKEEGMIFSIFLVCHAGLLYVPENSKKIFLAILDFEFSLLQDEIREKQAGFIESKFCLVFAFLVEKNFSDIEKVNKYLKNISYKKLAIELFQYYTNNYNSEIALCLTPYISKKKFLDLHSNPENNRFHLMDKNNNIILGQAGGSWSKTNDTYFFKKNNSSIFKQIQDYQKSVMPITLSYIDGVQGTKKEVG